MTLASLAVLIPLLAAGALAGTTSLGARRAADAVALLAAAAVTVLCLVLLASTRDGTVVTWLGNWLPRDGVALGIALVADPLAAALAAFAGALTVVALVVSLRLEDTAGHLFHALVLVFLAATTAFALSGDLFTIFVTFELLSVAGFAMAGFLVDHRSGIEGALNFAVSNTAGSVLLLTGIALLYGRTGALNLAQMGAALDHAGDDAGVTVAFALVCAGLLVKAAIVPFHFWLADAYAAAPTAVCIVFAGAMSELGLYGVARTYWTVFDGVLAPAGVRGVLLALGALTILVGGALCLVQRNLKRLLAFATISHMGVILLGVGLLDGDGLAGAAVYVVGDGMAKAGLFVAVGALHERFGLIDDVALFGRARGMRWGAAVFVLGGLELAGLPLSGPWQGRSLIEDGAEHVGAWWLPFVLVAGGALTGGAVLRVVRTVFLGRGERGPQDPAGEPGEEPEGPGGTLPRRLTLPAAGLVIAAFAWGLVPRLAEGSARVAARFIDGAGYAQAVLGGAEVRSPPLEQPAPPASAYLYALAAVALAVALGAAPLERPARALHGLRELHSGRPGDYLAWLAAGAAALAIACLAVAGT